MPISFDHPHVDDPALSAFAALAEDFCALIDAHAMLSGDAFVHGVHRMLPALYVGGLSLPATDILFEEGPEDAEDDSDEVVVGGARDADRGSHEEWRRLYEDLTSKLGARCYYREIFDPYEPPEEAEVTGSLADDIADIHHDIRSGLLKWRRGETGAALWEWRFHFEGHWGKHLTGALRALWARSSWYDDGWPDRRASAA